MAYRPSNLQKMIQHQAKLDKCTPDSCTYPKCIKGEAPKVTGEHRYRVEFEVDGKSDSMETEATSYADAGFKVGAILAIRYYGLGAVINCLDALRVW